MSTPLRFSSLLLLVIAFPFFVLSLIGLSSLSNNPNQQRALAQTLPTSGLVASFSFTNNASDSSTYNNSGTLFGSPSFTTDRTGQTLSALSLNGTNQYVSIPTSSSLNLSTGLSVSAWVNPSLSIGRPILNKWASSDHSYAFATHWTSPSEFYLALYNSSTGNYFVRSTSANIPVNTWTHLAATYNGSSVTLYKNGVAISSSATSVTGNLPSSITPNSQPQPLILGGDGSAYWNGSLDEVKLYNRALTLAEVQALAGVTGTPPPTQTCNNNIIEGSEVCDSNQLNGQSCTTRGFSGGTLSCNSSCTGYVTSGCTTSMPVPPTSSGAPSPDMEQRCRDIDALGGTNSCLCSEPLIANGTWTSGFYNPPGSITKQCGDDVANSPLYLASDQVSAGFVVPSGPSAVPTGSGIPYVFHQRPNATSNSPARLSGVSRTVPSTVGKFCHRFVIRYSSDWQAKNQDIGGSCQATKLAELNPRASSLASQYQWVVFDPNVTPGQSEFDLYYSGPGGGHMSGSTIDLQDCQNNWCYFEQCWQGNFGTGAIKPAARQAVILSNGSLLKNEILTWPRASLSAVPPVVFEAGGDSILNLYKQNTCGGERWFAYAMSAWFAVGNENMWIGPPSEFTSSGSTPSDPPPSISLSASPTSITTGSSISLSASASDNNGVNGVQLYVNGNAQGSEDTSSPYSFTYSPTSPGTYTFTATARDTINQLTTSAPVTVTVTSVVTPPTGGGGCTDGVDCYCDKIRNTTNPFYDSRVLLCEDWEAPNLYLDSPLGTGSWWDHGTFRRGTNSKWRTTYATSIAECNYQNGQPLNPKRGIPCNNLNGTCGSGEYASFAQGGGIADLWDANSFACIDIQRAGDVSAETPGLTLDRDPFDGMAHFAYRVTTNKAAGIVGDGNFSHPVTELGLTMAVAYPSNLAQAVGATTRNINGDLVWDGDFITEVNPWKHEEYGTRGIHLFMGNTGRGIGCPFCQAIPQKAGPAGCQSILNNINVLAGSASCNDTQLELGADSFKRSRDWPLGTWGCTQGYISGLGSTNGTLQVWFNERLLIHLTNVNWRDLLIDQSLSSMSWNTYYNGNGGGSSNVRAQSTLYRYNDNVHYREGLPVSCAQIGFSATTPPTSSLTSLSFPLSVDSNRSISNTPISVSILTPNSTTIRETQALTVNSQGAVTLSSISSLSPGSYDVRVKATTTLSRKQTFTLASNQTFTFTNKLLSGDLNNDNAVNSLDWAIMSSQWFQRNMPSDFNGDTVTNSLDFTWLNRNWFMLGE